MKITWQDIYDRLHSVAHMHVLNILLHGCTAEGNDFKHGEMNGHKSRGL